MPCCCVCKSPLLLIAAGGLALGAAMTFHFGPDDKKSEKPAQSPAATQPVAEQPKNADPKPADPTPAATDPYVLGFTMNRIEGTSEDLAMYRGKVVLIVNVASQCGYTKQYAGLEKLYESKKGDGFVILGFPANEFGKQEPGTNAEIKEFCAAKFNVSFPMFEKIVVKGAGTAPLYKKLAAQPAPIGGEPKWNFTKFLVDRNGNVVARYEPAVKPDDKDMVKKIEDLLKASPTATTSEPKSASPRPSGS
jgi:glutathione peroxidase